VLDDFSRYILAWRLAPTMGSTDVEKTLSIAVEKTGITQVKVAHRPRLLSDNRPAFVSDALRLYLQRQQIQHIRGAPYHPQTQGKIERWHRSMKSVVNLDNYYTPEALEATIASFVSYYNTQRYHESLDNVTPEAVYLGRRQAILTHRQTIKQHTLHQRRHDYLQSVYFSG
jgi:putative transposase